MSGPAFQPTTTAKIAAVILFSLVAVAFAQLPSESEVPPSPSTTEEDDEDAPANADVPVKVEAEAHKHKSRSSFALARRQSSIQCMVLARDAISRKDYLAALPLLEQALSEPNSFVPTGSSVEISTHEEASRLQREMPAELRQRFDGPRRVLARSAWERARSQGISEVTNFIQQFGELPLGVDAWWWLGCHERDHDRRLLAAAAFTRIARHPHSSNSQRAVALIAAIDSLVEAGQLTEAIRWRERLSELDANLAVSLGGQLWTVKQWLSEHPCDPPAFSRDDSSALSTAADRLRRPVLAPTWKQSLTVPFGSSVISRELKQRDQGMRMISILRPMIVGNYVIIRTLEGVHAFLADTGEPGWSIPNVEYREIERKRIAENGNHLRLATEWAQRRSLADSIFGRMSTDGRRLFLIQEPDRFSEFGIDRRQGPRGLLRTGPQFNRLCCHLVDSGTLEWEIGGPATKNLSDTFGGYFFLGAPLVVDGVVYAIAQRETELYLLAIDPRHGSLSWSLSLGAVLLPISEDVQRSRVACPIVWHDGLLLCSTSSGMVVAVDPLLRSLNWGYRYSATTNSSADLFQVFNQSDPRQRQEPWWDSWREPFAGVGEKRTGIANGLLKNGEGHRQETSVLVFTSPETDQLHAMEIPDGKPLWSIPRAEAQTVAGIHEDLVIVIEGDFVRAHDLVTGQQRWRTMTAEISGSIAFVGSLLILPAQAGGTIVLDIRSGKRLSESTTTDSSLGSLMETESGWIAYSRQMLMRLPRLEEVRRTVEQELLQAPTDEPLLVRAALLDIQAGDASAARKRLDGLTSSPARDLRRVAIIDALQDSDANRSDADQSSLSQQLKEFAEDADYKFAAAAAIGTASLAAGDLVATVNAALDGLTTDLDQPDARVKTNAVIVRKDRVLLGLIDTALRRANSTEVPLLNELFSDRLQEARKSRDRLSVQRFVLQCRGLDWSRELIVREDEKTLRKRTPLEVEIRLLDAAGSSDASIAIQALEKLAQRYDRIAGSDVARRLRQRILREFPLTKSLIGNTEAERISHDAEQSVLAPKPSDSGWPDVKPREEYLDDRNFGVYPIIPVRAEPGSLAERLDICVDRDGKEIRFRGGAFYHVGQDESREKKLDLPPNQTDFRGATGYMLRYGWGVGRIVILLVGSELFAISPVDEQGEPNPRFLWSNSIDLQGAPGDLRIVNKIETSNERGPFVVDESNRPIGRIGPVQPGYLCYQKGTKLVAVETETGGELWERLDIPADATVLGDDHFVYLWRQSNIVEVLSVIDGRKIEDRPWLVSPLNMIHHRGSLVWTVTREFRTKLELTDLRTGQSVWSREDPKTTQVSVLDAETLAVVTSEGQLHILAARTGMPLCPPLTVNASSLKSVVTWHDTDRWYVAMSSDIKNLATLQSHQASNSYRLRFIRGPLYAIDREQRKILWKKELHDEPLALDQSRVAPVLVQHWKLPPKSGKSGGEGVLRMIDKRTGETILNRTEDHLPFFQLNPDVQESILELKLPRETIRLHYETKSPTDSAK